MPEIFLDVIEEAGFLSPAGIDHDLADVAFDVGCQGTGAVVVLVVALAGIDGNEVVLDAPFYATWHVVVDGAETDRHADGFVVAVHGAVGYQIKPKVFWHLHHDMFGETVQIILFFYNFFLICHFRVVPTLLSP